MSDSNLDTLFAVVDKYVEMANAEVASRWDSWKISFEQYELYQTIGSLLYRQLTLASQLAFSPNVWNGHIAPIILRSMADVHITLAWILSDPLERSRKYILFGLGQNKLEIEQRKNIKDSDMEKNQEIIKAKESWANAQRFTFLTDVELGSWSGITTRKMAEEANCLDFYNFVYTPFSAATHSTWNHVGLYNVTRCGNPLHRFHFVPVNPEIPSDYHYLYLAGKYLNKSLVAFDSKYGPSEVSGSSFSYLKKELYGD